MALSTDVHRRASCMGLGECIQGLSVILADLCILCLVMHYV